MPTPAPETGQVEGVREMARLTSLSYTLSLINGLSDEQWAAQLLTNEAWMEARHDDIKIGGRVQIDPEKTRALLTDETRERLGLPALLSPLNGGPVSGSSPTEVIW